jgi:hypothetical protein
MTEPGYSATDTPLRDLPRHIRNCVSMHPMVSISMPAKDALVLARAIETVLTPPPPAPPPAQGRPQPIAGWIWWLSGFAFGLTMGAAVLPTVLP